MEKQDKTYQDANAAVIDRWIAEGWEWGKPVDHQTFVRAKNGQWSVVLTPTKAVPHEWFGDLKGKKLLGLASEGGQQMPIFTAAGATCTVLDSCGGFNTPTLSVITKGIKTDCNHLMRTDSLDALRRGGRLFGKTA